MGAVRICIPCSRTIDVEAVIKPDTVGPQDQEHDDMKSEGELVATAALTTKTSSLQSLFTTTATMLRLTT